MTQHLSKPIEFYSPKNEFYCTQAEGKNQPGCQRPQVECRPWQMNKTVLQRNDITMLKGVGRKGDNLNNFGNSALSGYRKAKDKNGLVHKISVYSSEYACLLRGVG